MPYVDVYLHFVWATKNRYPYLNSSEIRDLVWSHILLNAKSKNIHVLSINGYQDHCHCLVSLHPDQIVCKIAGILKGESSFWINKTALISEKFQWQDDYYVESVSPNSLNNVILYIQNQEEHHQHISFNQELEKFFIEQNLQNLPF